ncbi:RNA polymerase sigma factor [uncultured Piscinibacter sp.]|uniref:RNA polymerase sigma factor n=1 Tax=uncultured Piscinibacter sp. TaxID=1131835 RepID=UPI00262A2ECD|nr:RNA polymerase sigma factor [uncultured Piscinibacter sp.]
MNMDDPTLEVDLAKSLEGDARALERVLRAAQPLVFNLAQRMLGRREDALDATQEILLRVATHLSDYRGDSRFSTWVYRIAVNALLDERRAGERRRAERNFTELGLDLEAGIDRAEALPAPVDAVTPEQRVAVVELALVCTQGMLMALPAAQRLAYVLCEVMDLEGPEAAHIAGVSPAAMRQQLARARQALRSFVDAHCGLVSPTARCTCDRQLLALDQRQVVWLLRQPLSRGTAAPVLHNTVARQGLRDIRRLQSAAQLFRAHPEYAIDPVRVSELLASIDATVFGAGRLAGDAPH